MRTRERWLIFVAGVAVGVLLVIGALTASVWVWSGPDSVNGYFASSAVHSAASEQFNFLPITVPNVSVILAVAVLIAVIYFVKKEVECLANNSQPNKGPPPSSKIETESKRPIQENAFQAPVVVELTSKKYKSLIVLGNLLFFGSIAFFFFTFSQTARGFFSIDTGVSIVFVTFIVSIVVYSIGKFLAWWNHG